MADHNNITIVVNISYITYCFLRWNVDMSYCCEHISQVDVIL